VTTSAPVPTPAEPAADYSGTGTRTLPPLRLRSDTTVRWTSSGGIFFLIVMRSINRELSEGNPQLVVSHAEHGENDGVHGERLVRHGVDGARLRA
jgi:hypothetical protein